MWILTFKKFITPKHNQIIHYRHISNLGKNLWRAEVRHAPYRTPLFLWPYPRLKHAATLGCLVLWAFDEDSPHWVKHKLMNLLKIGKTLIFVCNKGLSTVTVTFTQKLHSGSAYPNFHRKTQEALERQNGLGEERITPTLSLSLSRCLCYGWFTSITSWHMWFKTENL